MYLMKSWTPSTTTGGWSSSAETDGETPIRIVKEHQVKEYCNADGDIFGKDEEDEFDEEEVPDEDSLPAGPPIQFKTKLSTKKRVALSEK